MARRVDHLPGGTKAHRLPDEWFDGSIWELTPGVDTRSQTPENVKKTVMHAAREHGYWCKALATDTHAYFQVTGRRA